MQKRSKRPLTAALAGLLLAALLLCGCGGRRPEARYRVVVATDLHYLSPALTDHGAVFRQLMEHSDGKVTEYCDEVTDAFLAQVVELKPEALILTGDLSFNGERESHLALAEKLSAVEAAGVPVLVLPGNHDLYRSQTYSYFGDRAEPVPGVTAEDFREIYAPFGYDDALSCDADSLSYAARLNDSTRVLMLDANTLHDYCGLSEETLAWVEEQLRQAKDAGEAVLVCCHQNLFRHSLFGPGYVLNRADRLAELLEKYGVPLFLSGHLHIQHWMTRGGVTEIATSSLTMGACPYALVEAEGGAIRYEARRTPVSAWAAEQGRTEEALLDFERYAAESMMRRTRSQAEEQLRSLALPEEERQALIDYACALNLAYFSGDLTGIPALDPEGALLRRWVESGTAFGVYFASLEEELGRSYIRWESGEN